MGVSIMHSVSGLDFSGVTVIDINEAASFLESWSRKVSCKTSNEGLCLTLAFQQVLSIKNLIKKLERIE